MSELPRIVVLDFDGVVLESLDVKGRAFAALFATHPDHVDAIVRLHVENGGMSRFEKFRRIHADILGLPLTEDEERRLGEQFSELVVGEVLRCPFVQGAEEFLRRMSARLPIYIASGTPEDELRDIVERRDLSRFFAGVFGTPRAKSELLEAICADAGVSPGESVFVGDARSDSEGAAAVGMPFVGRRIPGLPLPFDAGEATIVVDDLAELLERWDELEAALRRVAAAR